MVLVGTADNGRMASDILLHSTATLKNSSLPIEMLFILQDKIAYLRVDGIAGTATVSQCGTGDNAQ